MLDRALPPNHLMSVAADARPIIAMPDETPANPTCPNCGRPMTLVSPPDGDHDHHTFECGGCKVAYMTEDHTQISGKRPPQ